MAGPTELKGLYREMEAKPAEMAGYRERLSGKLGAPERSISLAWLLLPLGLTAALWLVAAWMKPVYPQTSPAELARLASGSDKVALVRAKARRVYRQGNARDRLNATFLLCLTAPQVEALGYAESGLLGDNRPDFRTFYLEFILDNGDERPLNAHAIERLMDRETDPLCLKLYKRLLKLA